MNAPGMYGWQDDGDGNGYWFFKRDDTNDRCMLLYVQVGCSPAYGLKPSDCDDIEKVILTNSAADCQYNIDHSPVPHGQRVEASCGGGIAKFSDDGYIGGYDIKAFFEFPQIYPWVPANDTYCFDKYISAGTSFVSGC